MCMYMAGLRGLGGLDTFLAFSVCQSDYSATRRLRLTRGALHRGGKAAWRGTHQGGETLRAASSRLLLFNAPAFKIDGLTETEECISVTHDANKALVYSIEPHLEANVGN